MPPAAGFAARKAAILDAARRGLITDRTAARHVAGLDAQILRIGGHDGHAGTPE